MKKINDYNAVIKGLKAWIPVIMTDCNAENAVLGMSGGTDSLVVGKALVDAIGPDHVFGMYMPNGVQADIEDARRCVKAAGIKRTFEANLALACMAAEATIKLAGPNTKEPLNAQAKTNLIPRVRQAVEYGVAQAYVPKSVVICTANLSELMMGYFTLWADMGSFAPIGSLTKTEVRQLGLALGLPEDLVLKAPADGLSGMTDEERLGFTYEQIDDFIRNDGANLSEGVRMAIANRAQAMEFKRKAINLKSYVPNLEIA